MHLDLVGILTALYWENKQNIQMGVEVRGLFVCLVFWSNLWYANLDKNFKKKEKEKWLEFTLLKQNTHFPKNFSIFLVTTRMTQNKMENKGLCAHELGCFLYYIYSWAPFHQGTCWAW
jgi:hypothetical protein